MLQELTLIGNLGNDPEMRYTPAGKAVCNFSLATNRKWNDANGQEVQETTWFRVSTWGRQAKVCNQYLAKGRRVFVRGRLNPDAGVQRQHAPGSGQQGVDIQFHDLGNVADQLGHLEQGDGDGLAVGRRHAPVAGQQAGNPGVGDHFAGQVHIQRGKGQGAVRDDFGSRTAVAE